MKDHQYTGGQVQATVADMSVTNLREAKVKVGVEGEVVTLNVIVLKEGAEGRCSRNFTWYGPSSY